LQKAEVLLIAVRREIAVARNAGELFLSIGFSYFFIKD
jgi:hypothetical protein